ncbi:MAG: NAD(P)/FAD-dependent oxidoreductase [Candidatus Omnitrophica bacterium]|nr:NAD(P)/FAD-dependent oxidoreductase [Candidatus Omnitrophota bacterium]
MAAIRADEFNQYVTLIEKNLLLDRKLLLSGKDRCNLTNAVDSFLSRR